MIAQKRQALGQVTLPDRCQSRCRQKAGELVDVRRTVAPPYPKVVDENRIGVALQQDQFIADRGVAGFEHAVIPSVVTVVGNVFGDAGNAIARIDLPAWAARLAHLQVSRTESKDVAVATTVSSMPDAERFSPMLPGTKAAAISGKRAASLG